MSVAAARSLLRSTATRTATAAARISSAPKPTRSPFRISKQNPLSHPIFRSPVELSCCVETMLPYHTATASAMLTSMLSVSRGSYGWTPEDQIYAIESSLWIAKGQKALNDCNDDV